MVSPVEHQMDMLNQTYPPLNKDLAAAIEEFASMRCEDQARAIVFDYARQHLDPSDFAFEAFNMDGVYVVQFTYILGNWKALISTTLADGMYYEVTFDKRRGVAYLDPYKRFDHKEVAIPASRR